ncbi:SDR family oxidoreductase [Pseudooceanicola sp.]|uniref:SDR family oxidoreductase n=1 Tax=Pseudooceanicola sp. TaxID=1914328 RepID=UPI004059873F
MPQALVTGAGKRLGRAIALDLAASGYDVAVHYGTSYAEAEEVAGLIRDMGRHAVTLRADLAVEGEVSTLVARAAKGLGAPLDCLVNNASAFEYDNVHSVTRESWDRHMECNLRAPFVLSQTFGAQCPAAEPDPQGEPEARSLIVNMIDQRVRKLTPEFTSYTLSRAALWVLTQTMAQGLAPDVRVNAIGPGPTLKGGRQDEGQFQRQRESTVLGRGSNPEDITRALRFLLSAPGVTGQMICTDGGQHLGWRTPDVMDVE